LWRPRSSRRIPWLLVALLIFAVNQGAATWRWHLLLAAQHVHVAARSLFSSCLVANFFNNFLPSNIGGDVIRIRDTARPAGSKTLAATVILVDRGLGMMALGPRRRDRRDGGGPHASERGPDLAVVAVGGLPPGRGGARRRSSSRPTASDACCSR
jgi:hypothetical protein